jgi:hypothetical protein
MNDNYSARVSLLGDELLLLYPLIVSTALCMNDYTNNLAP